MIPPRSLEALRAYALTGDIKAVACVMGVSFQTVKNHLSRAYRELDVTGAGAIAAFRALGWLVVPDGPAPESPARSGAVSASCDDPVRDRFKGGPG